MTSVHETAYPRLKLEFTEQELIAIYSPTPAELEFVASHFRQISIDLRDLQSAVLEYMDLCA